jgi:colanic acid biosynthesis glycosyl transferase WcaI
MRKRLLLIGYNFYPEPTGIGKYNGEMMTWLVARGYDCTVVTSYPYYPFWKVQEPYYKKRFTYSVEKYEDTASGGKLCTYRCPQYIPSKPTGLKRMLLDISFLLSACIPIVRLLTSKKFDFVLTVAPSFQVGFLGILFKQFHGSKLLYHIQDLQIEAARDLNMIKSKSAINLLFKAEKFILNRCDVISSISKGMTARIQEKSKKPVVLFPNWTDTQSFYPITNKAKLREHFGYSVSDKIVLYSGAIGEKQGLQSILNIANQLRSIKDLKFIICGSGPYKDNLQQETKKLGLKNLAFFPIQPHEKFNRFLNLADVHLVIQKASASDLVMPSKLTTILAVGGLALITADPGSGLYSFVKEHNIGVLVGTENPDALKDALLYIINNDLSHINRNARHYAESHLSVDKVMVAYEKYIQNGNTGYKEIPSLSKTSLSTVKMQQSRIPGPDVTAVREVRP